MTTAIDLLRRLEWSGIRRGQGTGFMGSGGNGEVYSSCPICHGLKKPNGEFSHLAVGHKPDCELAARLGEQ